MKSKSGSVGAISGGRHRKRRFTLVEILIVVSIIGILAAMLMPNLRNARERAREMQCMGNLRQIALGYNMYMKDHDGQEPMPPSGFFLDDMSIVYPYVRNIDVFSCPSSANPPLTSPEDLEVQVGANGNVSSRKMRDYMATCYDDWERVVLKGSLVNQGHGTSNYGINPDNPSGNFDLSDSEKWVIYEANRNDPNEPDRKWNHFRGYRNAVYVGDAHYIRYADVTKDSEDYVWFITMKENGRIDIGEVVQANKGQKK